MDIIQLYQDYSVPFVTEGHKHSRPGWVNVECPFCTGNPGYHLGYNLENEYWYCWRCGWHTITDAISKILRVSHVEARDLLRQYGMYVKREKKQKKATTTLEHRLPTNVGPLQQNHRVYLQRRGFDADKIEKEWHVMGTGPVSLLDGINFSHRLLIPIVWDNREVSFTTRDVTGRSSIRYLTCPKSRELTHHKHILYGRQDLWSEVGICVEGPADVWRVGVSSFCTFGIEYKSDQLKWMTKLFRKIVVIFDDDPQAVVKSRELVGELRFRGVTAKRIQITGDPAEMTQAEVTLLLSHITN